MPARARGIEDARVKTVLGLSVTSHGIAWALVDGRTDQLTLLDDDAFDVDTAGDLATRAASAACSAQAIAAASGQDVTAIGVSAVLVSDDTDQLVTRLLVRLAAAGFDDVRIVVEQSGGEDPDDGRVPSRVRPARAAAVAVATGAVARTPRPSLRRAPAARKHITARALAATAAAVAAGLLTVGSQGAQQIPVPAADDGDIAAAAQPQLITVLTPSDVARTVAEPSAEPAASTQAAERAQRVPMAEDPTVVATPAPQVVPAVQVASAAPLASPQIPAVPPQQPAVVAVGVPHLPPAAEPHLPAVEPHIAADPAPGPALVPVAAAPVVQPSPAQVAGLWFLGAMP
ncbi:hypothetical protein A5637_29640 [Mycolicibacterium fortuitum]|nr:hypothetical protein A5637_29640 [Mycolicibacterium fortuitum]